MQIRQISEEAHVSRRNEGRICFIGAAWHSDLVQVLREAMVDEMLLEGWVSTQIDIFQVPGAFEIPLHVKRLARSGRYAAIVACALVVNGGIYRHEFVASTVVDALMRVQLECDIPILSAVLTPRDFHEHEDHRQFFQTHLAKKGTEVAQACSSTLASLRALEATV